MHTMTPRSATDSPLKMFWVPSTLHLDLGNGVVDVAQVVGRQFHGGSSEVLFQPMQLRGARDRNNPRLLGKQPSECSLCARRLLPGCDFAEHVNERLIRLASLRCEARNDAEVFAVERR